MSNQFLLNIRFPEEAENERMHLMTALELKQPGRLFRGSVLVLQGMLNNLKTPSYTRSFLACLVAVAVAIHALHCFLDGYYCVIIRVSG